MLDAPRGTVFVWVNHHLDYPRSLARHLDREDLTIVSPGWLEYEGNWVGRTLVGLRVDPDARLTDAQWEGLHRARLRIREGTA